MGSVIKKILGLMLPPLVFIGKAIGMSVSFILGLFMLAGRQILDFVVRLLDVFLPLSQLGIWFRNTFPRLWNWLTNLGFAKRAISRLIFSKFGNMTKARPHSHSMAADYPTWFGFVDRGYTGRHLPPDLTNRSKNCPALMSLPIFLRATSL